MWVIGFLFNCVMSIVVGFCADKNGRSFGVFLILSLLMSFLTGFLVLLVIGKTNEQVARDQIEVEDYIAMLRAQAQRHDTPEVSEVSDAPEVHEEMHEEVPQEPPMPVKGENALAWVVVIILIGIIVSLGIGFAL